jgi:hypothetical protein
VTTTAAGLAIDLRYLRTLAAVEALAAAATMENS